MAGTTRRRRRVRRGRQRHRHRRGTHSASDRALLSRRSRPLARHRGTGLGLAIVKHALERHQAELHIESEPGHGSTFSARFPAHRVGAG
ncbi:MAG TPA: ATP-binding protein [Rhodocyclaceae bacterium]|nr:ATP-binding protein [Rhodocyclaceae bacterium]